MADEFKIKEQQLLEQISDDNAEAMYLLGLHYYNNQRIAEACDWFEKASLLGHGDAYYYLGLFHETEAPTSENEKHNLMQADIYYAIGTDCKSPKATCKLGKMYLYGIRLKVDTEKGIQLLRKAVRLKSVDACEELAICYEKGIGVEIDLKKSAKYAKKAAELAQSENL